MMDNELNIKRRSILILTLFIAVACFIAFYFFINGNKVYLFDGIENDTKTSYLMQYSNIFNQLLDHDFSFFDFNLNGGFDLMGSQMMLFDPFTYIIYLIAWIGGIASIPFGMTAMVIVKIFFAGFACYFFLSVFRFSEKSKIIAAFIYSFSGYVMIWSPHYFFITILIFLPVVLLFLEMSFYKRKYLIGLIIIIALTLCFSLYFSFSVLLLIAIYGIARFFMINKKPTLKLAAGQLLPIVFSVIIGILLSGFILLPEINFLLFSSDRLATSAGFFDRLFSTSFFQFLTQNGGKIFLQSFTTSYSQYATTMTTYFSSLFIVFLPQFIYRIFSKDNLNRNKVIKILAVLFCAAFIFTPYIENICNALNGYSPRFTYILMPFFAFLIAQELDTIIDRKKLNKPILWGTVVFLVLLLCCYLFNTNFWTDQSVEFIRKFALMLGILFALGFCAILFILNRFVHRENKKKQVGFWVLFLAVMVMLNLCADAMILDRTRLTNTPEQFDELYNQDIFDSVQYIKENEGYFYRTEKATMTVSQCGEAGIYDYNGLSIYNSVPNKYLSQFYTKLWSPMLIAGNPVQIAYIFNPLSDNLMESLTNIKYIITNTTDYDSFIYNKVANFGSYSVLENPNVRSLGVFYTNAMNESDFEKLSLFEQKMSLYDSVLINDSDTIKDISYSAFNDMDISSKVQNDRDLSDTLGYKSFDLSGVGKASLNKASDNFLISADGTGGFAGFALDRAQYMTDINKGGNIYLTLNANAQIADGMEEYARENKTVYWINIYFDCGNGYQFNTEARYPLHADKEEQIVLTVPHNAQSMMFEFAALDEHLQSVNDIITGVNISGMKISTIDDLKLPEMSIATFEVPEKSNTINGKIEAKDDGYLFISIPYDKGWSVYANGQKVPVMRADYGFMAIKLTKGTYDIQLKYQNVFLRYGLIVTIIGLAAFGLMYWFYIRKGKKKTQMRINE